MELRDIGYFTVVAEQKHLGRAAEVLGLTQPALSKSLRRLETAVGAKLVKRTSKGVELTAEGAALASHGRQLRLSLDDVGREIRDLSHGHVGNLRIGAAPGIADRLLPGPFSALLKDTQKLAIRVTIGHNNVLLPALRNGELDLIVSGTPDLPQEDLVQERLCDDGFVVFGSASHPLAGRENLSPADLVPFQWASAGDDVLAWQWLRRAFESRGLPTPRSALEAGSHSLRGLVTASSNLLCFNAMADFLESARHAPLNEIPVKALKWTRHTGVSYRKDAYLPPAARRLIDLLKKTAREIATST